MTDTNSFIRRFTESLLHVAAEHNGAGDVEAFRRYQTDTKFHAQIDTIVLLAVQALEAVDQVDAVERYSQPFWDEANSLLGWDQT
jgi:hypothetical protein